jgi:putative endonuclease
MTHLSLGAWGEAVAREHLASNGFIIHASNWRCAEGEIDLVAETGGVLVFVEVKTRRSQTYGTPEEAVGGRKARRLLLTATAYLEAHQLADVDWRIDVMAITAGRGPRVLRLEHYADAVEGRLP